MYFADTEWRYLETTSSLLELDDDLPSIDTVPEKVELHVDRGQIVIEFVETGQQLTDVLTKPLGRF